MYDGEKKLKPFTKFSTNDMKLKLFCCPSNFWIIVGLRRAPLQYADMVSMYIRVSHIFLDARYQGILKATVSEVFEDLMFKISEGSDQN